MTDVRFRFDVLTCCRSRRTVSWNWRWRWSTVVRIWSCHSKAAQKKVRNESTTPSPDRGHERRQFACKLPQQVIKTTLIQIVPEKANKSLHFDKFWSICLTRVVCTKVLGRRWLFTSQCGICVNGSNVAAEIGYTCTVTAASHSHSGDLILPPNWPTD